MTARKRKWIVTAVSAVVLGIAISIAKTDWKRDVAGGDDRVGAASSVSNGIAAVRKSRGLRIVEVQGEDVAAKPPASEQDREEDKSAEDEAAEERAVDDFDAVVDQWMEGDKPKQVAAADIDAFLQLFAKVPNDRKEECLQRAINLVPDESVVLLVAVLMDKRQPKELVELVFNDILNRDESVKEPILKRILADKDHPCYKDAAWIMDVADEDDGKGEANSKQ